MCIVSIYYNPEHLKVCIIGHDDKHLSPLSDSFIHS